MSSYDPSYNSGFISTLLNNFDILSSISGSVPLSVSTGGGAVQYTGYYGRYFYLGNLLIQFIDLSNSISAQQLPTNTNPITITFPTDFSGNPYVCVPFTFYNGSANSASSVNVYSNSNQSFKIYLLTNNNYVGFIAIGQRP
jgi:hypothetical protein